SGDRQEEFPAAAAQEDPTDRVLGGGPGFLLACDSSLRLIQQRPGLAHARRHGGGLSRHSPVV
ncbi:MAG: hypothetical protein V1724_09485, partial [Chloroflexota bacterium]